MGITKKKQKDPFKVNDYPYIEEHEGGGIILAKLDEVVNWARSNSLWPLTFGTRCCAIEFMAVGASRHDMARFGFEVARATPRQADMILISGSITYKMAPVLKRLYDQMAEPKYVIAVGGCAVSGGPFFYNSYSVVKGADHIIPVDVYVPGCPPRPEAVLFGMLQLQKKVRKERTLGRKTKHDEK
jgi:NADH-quinone oxidoreductase subunit B